MNPGKQLIVNADDFGFTGDVNRGIVEAHRRGIVTAATLMANGEAFEDAVRQTVENPLLDVGCHLVLIGGRSLLPPHDPLPRTVPRLLAAIVAGRIRVYEELAEQTRRIIGAGIAPTHLDTHKHTHLAPPVLEAVARISEEFRIPWVRRPLGSVRWRVLERRHCRTTDHLAGFRLTGRFRTEALIALIRSLPDGLTELLCHPGRCGDELRRARTRLKESRELELEALTAPETRRAIEESGVWLMNYRNFPS